MRAVRPLFVVKLAPTFDQDFRFGTTAEPFAVEQFVTQLAVEAFDKAVLPGTAWCDECRTVDLRPKLSQLS
jgi:hypothetical protein